MADCRRVMQRDLTSLEHLILSDMCQGKSNSAIANHAQRSTKVIENTMSRTARVFGISSNINTNIRVLLALAYRANYGDFAIESLNALESSPGLPQLILQ